LISGGGGCLRAFGFKKGYGSSLNPHFLALSQRFYIQYFKVSCWDEEDCIWPGSVFVVKWECLNL